MFTSLSGTTITFTICLPSMNARDLRIRHGARSGSRRPASRTAHAGGRAACRSPAPRLRPGPLSPVPDRRRGQRLAEHRTRRGPAPPKSPAPDTARTAPAAASASPEPRRPRAPESCASSAYRSFISSIMPAIEVLKCQRDSKSSVILRMVWCSLRSTLRSAAGSPPSPPRARAPMLRVTKR